LAHGETTQEDAKERRANNSRELIKHYLEVRAVKYTSTKPEKCLAFILSYWVK
jgi:hypothetical protein